MGILLNGKTVLTVVDYLKADIGRVLKLKLKLNNQCIQILSIYVPDRPHFRDTYFQTLPTYIFDHTPMVLGGDFNMVENPLIDRQGGVTLHTHTQGIVHLQR